MTSSEVGLGVFVLAGEPGIGSRFMHMLAAGAVLLGATSLSLAQWLEPSARNAAVELAQVEAPAADGPPPPPAPQAGDQPPPPPAANVAELVKYYVAVDGKTTGPFTIDEVKAKIAEGSITALTMVWKKGQAGWEPAEKLPEVAAALAETPKAPPFDCVGFIVGTWQKSAVFNGQNVTTVSQYEKSGQFTMVQTMQGLPGVSSYGSWNATAVADKSCSITMNVKYPTTASGTVVVDITGRDTVTDKSDGSQYIRLR